MNLTSEKDANPSLNITPVFKRTISLLDALPEILAKYFLIIPEEGCINLFAKSPSVVKSNRPVVVKSNLPIDIYLCLSSLGRDSNTVFLFFGSFLVVISSFLLL